jgi:hypothetical protein
MIRNGGYSDMKMGYGEEMPLIFIIQFLVELLHFMLFETLNIKIIFYLISKYIIYIHI